MSSKIDKRAQMEERVRAAAANASAGVAAPARTAPMNPPTAHVAAIRENLADENRSLKERIKQLEEQGAISKLAPESIRRSRFCNRHDAAFSDSAFQELKADIERTGINDDPILVRPTGPNQYEIVYGHRRHEACRQLGLLVKAIVENVDDVEALRLMESENSDRSDLSPFEQGMSYARMLREKVFPHAKALAERLKRSEPTVSRLLAFGEIPDEVLAVFADPRKITLRNAQDLRAAVKRDADRVRAIAREIRETGTPAGTKARIERLLNAPAAPRVTEFKDSRGAPLARVQRTSRGHTIELLRTLTTAQLKEAFQAIERLSDPS